MTMFGHRNGFGRFRTYTGVPGGYRNPPGVYWASWALVEKRGGGQGRPHAPSPSSPYWTRKGGGAPFASSPLSLPSPLLLQQGKEESYSHSPLGAPSSWPAASPLAPLYTGAGGTSTHTS